MRFHLFHHSPRALLLSFSGGEWSVTHLTSTYNSSLLKMEMISPVMFLLLIGEHSTNLCVVLICSDWDIFSPCGLCIPTTNFNRTHLSYKHFYRCSGNNHIWQKLHESLTEKRIDGTTIITYVSMLLEPQRVYESRAKL